MIFISGILFVIALSATIVCCTELKDAIHLYRKWREVCFFYDAIVCIIGIIAYSFATILGGYALWCSLQ